MMEFASSTYWFAVLQIIAIDILLGGDNAVVIALASRRLPVRQRNKAIAYGVLGAIALRVTLISFALQLLRIPFLKIVGGVLLLWIGTKLLLPGQEGDHDIDASADLFGAVKTIVVADAVMSLDNVIAVAAAAKDNLGRVVFGLVVSVPIIVWGSKLVLALMDRFPVVIVFGAALLGWIAGDMIAHDLVVKDWVAGNAAWLQYGAPAIGATLVVLMGKMLVPKPQAAAPVDLAASDPEKKPGDSG
ncbi:MAG: TerC family protein [Burkholderiales bacterium]|nr:TerC family protein [Burkholderiales bacterium]